MLSVGLSDIVRESIMQDGKLRARIDQPRQKQGVVAAFVVVGPDSNESILRMPTVRRCSSTTEIRSWVEREAPLPKKGTRRRRDSRYAQLIELAGTATRPCTSIAWLAPEPKVMSVPPW